MIRFSIDVPAGYTIVAGKQLLGAVLRAAGNEVAARARALIRSGGATKKRAAKRLSIAGQPPVSRTGTLARGLKVRLARSGEAVTIRDIAQARGQAFYALFLEKGAKGGVGSGKKSVKGKRNKRGGTAGARILLAHPFMEPALDQVVANGLADRVRDAVIGGLAFRRGG